MQPGKYTPESLPDLKPGEPWFILRGQDILAPLAVQTYAAMLRAAAAGASAQINELDAPAGKVRSLNVYANTARELAREAEAIASQMIAWQSQTMGGKLPD